MSKIDSERVNKIKESLEYDSNKAKQQLYEWTKTGVINFTTFKECLNLIKIYRV